MKTEICRKLGIEYPIFAFSHCRDVVAAVSNVGGLGVLGAVGFSPEQLERELLWIDERVGERPYGVDIVIPGKYEGKGEQVSAEALEEKLRALIPPEHRDFAKKLLSEAGVPELPEGEKVPELLGWTAVTAGPLVQATLGHPKVRLVANALGTPPADMVREIQESGRLVAALAGSVRHALSHREAGVDVVICQGGEGGGHTGEVGSIVLWPEVIDAVAPTPVLAAGGIGNGRQMAAAMAMGAEGVWCGTIWLTATESDCPPEQKQSYLDATSHDTVRSRSFTGKPARMLRNEWTDAWDRDDAPDPLGMPLQYMLASEAVVRGHRYPAQAQSVGFNPCGQIVGSLRAVRSVRHVVDDLIEEFLDAVERLNRLLAE